MYNNHQEVKKGMKERQESMQMNEQIHSKVVFFPSIAIYKN